MIDPDTPPRAATPDASRHDGFAGRLLLALFLITLFAAGAALVVVAADVLLLAFAGILLAVGLRGAARAVRRRTGLGEGWSLAVVIGGLTVLAGLAAWLLAASFAGQMNELWSTLGEASKEVRAWLRQWPWGARLLGQAAGGGGPGGGTAVDGEVIDRAARAFSATLGGLGALVVIGFVGLYLAVDPAPYRRGLVRLFPKRHRPRAEGLLDELDDVLYRWLIGRLLNMAIVGAGIAVGLWALGVPLVLALSLLAFVLDFIPYVGPILSTIPAAIVAASVGPQVAVYVVILYFVVQTAESYLLTPLIQKKAVELPPAVTIVSQVLLGGLTGVIGLAMAPPLTAVILTLVERLYVEDVLDDRSDAAANPDAPAPRDP